MVARMLRPGVKYTFAELEGFREDPSFSDWAAKGYVWRQELDGTLKLVHWSKAHMDNEVRNPKFYVDKRDVREIFPTDPIQKRTPQQRLQSLVDKWWEDCRRHGTVPGLTSEEMTDLTGRSFTVGEDRVTYEDVKAIAAKMLNQAFAKQEAQEAKKVVRTSPTD